MAARIEDVTVADTASSTPPSLSSFSHAWTSCKEGVHGAQGRDKNCRDLAAFAAAVLKPPSDRRHDSRRSPAHRAPKVQRGSSLRAAAGFWRATQGRLKAHLVKILLLLFLLDGPYALEVLQRAEAAGRRAHWLAHTTDLQPPLLPIWMLAALANRMDRCQLRAASHAACNLRGWGRSHASDARQRTLHAAPLALRLRTFFVMTLPRIALYAWYSTSSSALLLGLRKSVRPSVTPLAPSDSGTPRRHRFACSTTSSCVGVPSSAAAGAGALLRTAAVCGGIPDARPPFQQLVARFKRYLSRHPAQTCSCAMALRWVVRGELRDLSLHTTPDGARSAARSQSVAECVCLCAWFCESINDVEERL